MKRSVRGGLPQYTYRQANTQEKLIYRRMIIIGGLTVVLLLIIWLWGLAFIRIIGALGTKSVDETSTDNIDLPLLKPVFSNLPEFTNQDKITISGSTTAEVTVTLFVNGTQVSKTVTDPSGNFSFVDVSLSETTNIIKAVASNKGGGTEEQRVVITLDKQPPTLQLSSPSDGQTFPKETKTITIKGAAEADNTVFINSIQAIMDRDGNFSYNLDVQAGENKIEVKATDKAGDAKVIDLTVTVGT